MNNLFITDTKISKLFISIGCIGLLISLIDIFNLVFPTHFSDVKWIFEITQALINSFLASAICIIFLLSGINLAENYSTKKNLLIFEKSISLVSIVIGLFICTNLLFYSLSIKSYETNIVSNIKTQSEEILKKLDQIYEIQKAQVPEKIYKQKVDEIKQNTSKQIKYSKKTLLKKAIINIIEMILYISLFFFIGISSFNSSKSNMLKLKFAGSKQN